MEKPSNTEYFYRDKSRKDGLTYNCKMCVNKRTQKHYHENKEEMRERSKEKYQRNKEWYTEYYQENKEKEHERNRRYYQENKEKLREYNKKYYQENQEKLRERANTYRLENPKVRIFYEQRRRARMAELPHDLTEEEWYETLEYFNNECAYCGDSESGLAQEHVIPVSKGGPYTQENIIPACQSCNSSKHVADLEGWYLSYEHYDEERLNKILDYIEIMEEIK